MCFSGNAVADFDYNIYNNIRLILPSKVCEGITKILKMINWSWFKVSARERVNSSPNVWHMQNGRIKTTISVWPQVHTEDIRAADSVLSYIMASWHGNIFRLTVPCNWREIQHSPVDPPNKGDVFRGQPEQDVENTTDLPLIGDVNALSTQHSPQSC